MGRTDRSLNVTLSCIQNLTPSLKCDPAVTYETAQFESVTVKKLHVGLIYGPIS
jgi:hypothetical protein